MATKSKVIICNKALNLIRAKRISALTDDTIEARLCNDIYPLTLETILMEHPWSFAQKRADLAVVDETPEFTDDLMTIVYQKPSDALRINFVNNRSARFKLEGNKILSDTSDLAVKYTYLNDIPQQYNSDFITAFAYLLASEMAFVITNSRSLAEDMVKMYEGIKLPKAQVADSQQGSPQEPLQSEWLASRISGVSSGISGATGWETWFPIGC